MGQAVVVLKKGEGRTLKAGGMWVYDNEIASVTGSYEDGDMVIVRDFDGFSMGRGFINRHSKIRVRLMTRHIEQEIDREFLKGRLQTAWDYRKKVTDISSCRLVFGEADFLPGLVVDKFSDVLVVQVTALGMDRMKLEIVDLLKEILMADGIEIKGVYERSDGKYRDQEGMERIKDFIGEPFDTDVPIMENGVRYIVDVKDGQKTGFFLDQKYNRLAIQKLCRGGESTGLLYTYRLLRIKCRDCRCSGCYRCGCIGVGGASGRRECCFESAAGYRAFSVCRCF